MFEQDTLGRSVLAQQDKDRARAELQFWRGKTETRLIALAVGLGPVFLYVFWSHLTRDQGYQVHELLLYPLLAGGLSLIWILFLHTRMCGFSISSFQLKPGTWYLDILGGMVLTVLLFALHFVLSATVLTWLPRSQNWGGANLLKELAETPWMLAIWLGPVVWIGVAGFEELSRVFLLSYLWSLLKTRRARWTVLLLSALLFGSMHLYQGVAGVVGVGILNILWGWVYLRFGRVWPLIISHALFDSLQVIYVVGLIRGTF